MRYTGMRNPTVAEWRRPTPLARVGYDVRVMSPHGTGRLGWATTNTMPYPILIGGLISPTIECSSLGWRFRLLITTDIIGRCDVRMIGAEFNVDDYCMVLAVSCDLG